MFESLRERLHDVVVDDEDGEEHQGGEADLRDALLELDAQVAADGAFDQQQHDNAAVEHGDREQVEDTEVQTDGCHQAQQVWPALPRRLARETRDPDGTFERAGRHLVAEDLPDELEDQAGEAHIGGDRLRKGVGKAELTGDDLSMKRYADAPARFRVAFDGRAHRCQSRGPFLSVARVDHFHLAALVGLDDLGDLRPEADGTPVDGSNDVTSFETGIRCREVGLDRQQRSRHRREPSRKAEAGPSLRTGRDGTGQHLAVPLDPNVQILIRIGDNQDFDVLPGGVLLLIDCRNDVAGFDACCGGGGVLVYPPDHRRSFLVGGPFIAIHVEAGQQENRQKHVHGRTHDGNDKALPSWFRLELVLTAGGLVRGLLASHLDVAPERQGTDPIIRIPVLEAKQTRPETERKHIDADAKVLGGQEVAELMDQNHDAQDEDHGKDVGENVVQHDFARLLVCGLLHPPAGSLAAEPVVFKRLIHSFKPPRRDAEQHILNQFRDRGKRDAAVQKGLDRDFVGCVQCAWIGSSLLQGFIGKPQARKPFHIGLHEFQQSQSLPVKAPMIGCKSLRIG